MEKNRTSVELANDHLNAAVTQEARRSTERSEVTALGELELMLVGGGGNDTPLW